MKSTLTVSQLKRWLDKKKGSVVIYGTTDDDGTGQISVGQDVITNY